MSDDFVQFRWGFGGERDRSPTIMTGLLGKKKGMTQLFSPAGELLPVTVVEAGPCQVVQRKTKETDGYDAVQLGFGEIQEQRVSRPYGGHFKKKNLKPLRHLREFEVAGEVKAGDWVKAEVFKPGDRVDVIGISKGKGFQGVIKRHGKAGGPASHGSRFHRSTGSIGQRTSPGEVFKNMKLPGHMGQVRVTTKNIEVVEVRDNLVFLKGSVPGANESVVVLRKV